jgi:hypothetical protein
VNYKLIRSVLRFFGMSLVVGTAVAFASPTDTKPAESATKFKRPTTNTTNRMQKRPPAVKPAGGTQLEYAKPAGSGNGAVKVNSTLTQTAPGGAGNNKSTKAGGNGQFKQNTVNKAGYQLGGSHGDDTPMEKRSATGGGGGVKSTGRTTGVSSADLIAHPASGSSTKPHGAKSTAPAKTTNPVRQ